MKQVKVYSVILISQLGQYLLTLEEINGIRLIPIWVGPAEGMSISAKLNNQGFPRPLTHDLLTNMLKKASIKLKKVTISELRESTFYAMITLILNGKTLEIDARPSDAIAIALRGNAPIFVSDAVIKKCPIIQKPISKKEVEHFKKNIKDLKPEDFFRSRKA